MNVNVAISRRRNKDGFTLAEILCALAVLSILVLLIAQLMNGATKTMSFNENHMEVDGQMRTVFASMANDFTNMVRKSNVDVLFSKQNGNDYMFFYSQAEAYFDPTSVPTNNESPFSVVGYRVWSSNDAATGNGNYRLERYSQGLSWDNTGDTVTAGPIYYTYSKAVANGYTNSYLPNSNFSPDPATTLAGGPWSASIPSGLDTNTPDYHVIGDGIFRFEFCFLHTDGTYSDSAQIPPPAAPQGSPAVPPKPLNVLTDVLAVVVTVAELDPASQKMVPSMSTLINEFPDSNLPAPANQTPPPSTPPDLMATTWQNKLNEPGFAASVGIPNQVAAKIRIYQHFFYLNND